MSSFAIIYCYLIRLHIGRFVSLYQRKLYYNLILGTFTESTKSKEEKSVSFVVDYRQKCISNIKRPIKTIIHFHGCFCCCCCCCCVLVSKRSNYFNNLIVIGFIEIKWILTIQANREKIVFELASHKKYWTRIEFIQELLVLVVHFECS